MEPPNNPLLRIFSSFLLYYKLVSPSEINKSLRAGIGNDALEDPHGPMPTESSLNVFEKNRSM